MEGVGVGVGVGVGICMFMVVGDGVGEGLLLWMLMLMWMRRLEGRNASAVEASDSRFGSAEDMGMETMTKTKRHVVVDGLAGVLVTGRGGDMDTVASVVARLEDEGAERGYGGKLRGVIWEG